ncbi:MAG: alpha/beta hydrolase [Aphanocapsa sp. GSE-SYN-MK-11-07L]|jgi:acetyl esterase/lipase|nr:alpha/beta hydrolase [Aphanocapsa sp. GSE-SYN-MK-11-07L]
MALSAIGLFVSSWIVIPAPTFLLLPLSVGAPEISPWLVVGNAIALLLLLQAKFRRHWLYRFGLAASLLALMLSLLPLLQLPGTHQRFETVISSALGADYLKGISAAAQQKMRPAPFVLVDAFRGIPAAKIRQTTGIEFARPDRVPLRLNLYQPAQVGSYPALVVVHGGAWQSGHPSDNEAFSRYLAARGYVVVAIGYRYAPRFQFPAQLEDLQAALVHLQQRAAEYEIDPDRMAIMGRSAGSQLAMLAGYQPSPFQFKAVIGYYGPVDLKVGYYDLPSPDPIDIRAVLRSYLGGTPQQVGDRYQQASPWQFVTRSLPPTLLVYGDRDHLVEAKFGRAMSERLQASGNRAVYLEIPWADHAFDSIFNGVSNQLALYSTERFLAWAVHQPDSLPDKTGVFLNR